MSFTDEEAEGCCFQLLPSDCSKNNEKIDSIDLKGNNNNEFQTGEGPKTFLKKARVNLSFEDIRYTVKQWTLKSPIPVTKEILKGVSGLFPAGELTAIMGPSGAGKSTLLNVLASFTLRGTSGRVLVNGKERNPEKFRKQICYIQQDDYLRTQLTVGEAMNYASDLKLGGSVSRNKRTEQIKEILELLGLSHCWNTPSGGLSGGQRKRLSIALELISNPPIIFLDEPTSGLDSSSCTLCVSLLKLLAKQGRTVVCTIHQPSSLVFEKFDNVYAVSAGKCVYSGKTTDLVPYLANVGLQCPQYHNPADFLIDVAIGEFGADLQELSRLAKVNVTKIMAHAKIAEAEKAVLLHGENNNDSSEEVDPSSALRPASLIQQTFILTRRSFLMLYKKPMLFLLRAACHIFIGLIFGYLYYNSGYSATSTLATYVWIYGSNLFLVYTGKMAATLLFPMELQIVIREHFNRWYKLVPYYISIMMIEIPFQVLCCLLYFPISYYLTGMPFDNNRFWIFLGATTILSLVSQAMGFFIGILFPRKIAVFIGPIWACLLSVVGFCLTYRDTIYALKWLHYFSYFRGAFHISMTSVFGMNRAALPCPDEQAVCFFSDPTIILRETDAVVVDVTSNYLYITFWFFLAHALTFFVTWYKLNRK